MEKYLSIDTNIFIQCCLLEEEGDDIGALNKLQELLDNNSTKLLLPEVVELEFYKKLTHKTSVIQKQIDKYKEAVAKDGELDKKVKADIIENLRRIMEDRLKNKTDVENKIQGIFSHSNTIKAGLEITPELLARSYKYHLGGRKPYKAADRASLQPDCIIIQSLSDFLKGRMDYELYFCSLNESDFAEETKPTEETKNDNPPIHPDIKSIFHHIEYRKNLLDLLNEKFGAEFPKESIDKLQEKAVIEINLNDTIHLSDDITAALTAESEVVKLTGSVIKEENKIVSP